MRAILYFVLITAAAAGVPGDRTAIFPGTNTSRLIDLCVSRPTGITGYWQVETKDLEGVEAGLGAFLFHVWAKRGVDEKRRIDWKHYFLQVGGIIQDGRRVLFLSYAWAPDIAEGDAQARAKRESEMRGKRFDVDWWKTKPILVRDGGWQIFRVIYDLKLKQFIWYDQNLPFDE